MSEKVELDVTGMSCQGCVRSVKAILGKSLGLDREQVEVDLESGKARFEYEGDGASLEQALARLEEQGFASQRA